ncbi:MAG TPA: tRNA (5-methylaminomethyl-2-thiouridine)(34)-methyltransferase MnmD [Cyclobacteriaceae bacterium]|nr:tRNA (5-methylaminomethyl-2-thiouridine)(34)-methyltransferase MnmD [Cyclobacteriaceae bacterium]
MSLTIITTEDGSHSLRNEQLHETYHSIHGAVQESKHVFILNGFDHQVKKNPSALRILEAGFGTGLNALLTAMHTHIPVYYESWELYPLPVMVVDQLNHGFQMDAVELFRALHGAPWNQAVSISSHFTLCKRSVDLLQEMPVGRFDIIYYDAFAPSKQPALWEIDILRKMTNTLVSGGVFVTYCAKGQLKRDLASLGLNVETLAGPPGKKEMVRAIR